MRNFITCLEFLTRLRFSKRTEWRDDDFSRSVPYFPLVGFVMGLFMSGINYGLYFFETPLFLRGALLILAELVIIGGLMYDGYMDTADGVFSARSRERMLEIMKDSHVGSNAVIALVCLVLMKFTAFITLDPVKLCYAFVAAYVATRTFMVSYIVNYPYPRKTGIGHMFTAYAKPIYTYVAFGICLLLVFLCGLPYLCTGFAAFIVCQFIARYLTKQLGGLTGDTYGFLTEIGMVTYLIIASYVV